MAGKPPLKEITLDEFSNDPEHGKRILAAMSKNEKLKDTLESLRLQGNDKWWLGDENFESLISFISRLERLVLIDFTGIKANDEVARKLAEFIACSSSSRSSRLKNIIGAPIDQYDFAIVD